MHIEDSGVNCFATFSHYFFFYARMIHYSESFKISTKKIREFPVFFMNFNFQTQSLNSF